jgi:uncharacterized membrane protein YdjX (TVP38/TMEM64 family)
METFLKLLEYIDYNLDNNYFIFLLFLFIFMLVYNSFSLPGNIILMASTGYFFGLIIGYIISILTLTLGSLIFFMFFSNVIKNYFPENHSRYLQKINNYTNKNSLEYILILRIIPGTPLFLQNLFLASLKIKKSIFFFMSLIGFTPIVFLVVFFGKQLNNLAKFSSFKLADILSVEYFIFLILVFLILFIRIIFKKK